MSCWRSSFIKHAIDCVVRWRWFKVTWPITSQKLIRIEMKQVFRLVFIVRILLGSTSSWCHGWFRSSVTTTSAGTWPDSIWHLASPWRSLRSLTVPFWHHWMQLWSRFAQSPPSASWLPSPSSWWLPATAARSSLPSTPSWQPSLRSFMTSAAVDRLWRWLSLFDIYDI